LGRVRFLLGKLREDLIKAITTRELRSRRTTEDYKGSYQKTERHDPGQEGYQSALWTFQKESQKEGGEARKRLTKSHRICPKLGVPKKKE